ncbi:hypothetical protein BGX29_004184 [Mortierella sp. GBA35]|nr:hypothetical protein BGX29_004184 [Mortierella sp. GBA35]
MILERTPVVAFVKSIKSLRCLKALILTMPSWKALLSVQELYPVFAGLDDLHIRTRCFTSPAVKDEVASKKEFAWRVKTPYIVRDHLFLLDHCEKPLKLIFQVPPYEDKVLSLQPLRKCPRMQDLEIAATSDRFLITDAADVVPQLFLKRLLLSFPSVADQIRQAYVI